MEAWNPVELAPLITYLYHGSYSCSYRCRVLTRGVLVDRRPYQDDPLWTIWVGARCGRFGWAPCRPGPHLAARASSIARSRPNNLKKNLYKIYVITMYKFKTWQIDLDKHAGSVPRTRAMLVYTFVIKVRRSFRHRGAAEAASDWPNVRPSRSDLYLDTA